MDGRESGAGQQLVKEIAAEAGITKNVYPHLLRHTMAQYLACMPLNVRALH